MKRHGIEFQVKNKPILDENFLPLYKFNQAFLEKATKPLKIALERNNGYIFVFDTFICEEAKFEEANKYYVERMVKALLWCVGGFKVTICGDKRMANHIKTTYSSAGARAFDDYVRDIYIRAAKEVGDMPVEVCNDGDVTALAGAISLNDTNILGIAMGTSEAGGYVDEDGNIKGWLNELAFMPCDGQNQGSIDEKLKIVQETRDNRGYIKGVEKIYQTIGCYLGHTLAYYSTFYDMKHVLLMGRVVSGEGGEIILGVAKNVLKDEYPTLASRINLQLPDEKSRRVGQSVAAASLPKIQNF